SLEEGRGETRTWARLGVRARGGQSAGRESSGLFSVPPPSSWPGLPRPSMTHSGTDGRDKPSHDGGEGGSAERNCSPLARARYIRPASSGVGSAGPGLVGGRGLARVGAGRSGRVRAGKTGKSGQQGTTA